MNARRGTANSFNLASTIASLGGPLVVTLVLAVVGGGLTILLLSAAGFFSSGPTRPSRKGMIAVPKSVRPIKAFTKVRREDIVDLNLGDDSFFWMTPEQVKANPQWVINPSQIIGRVLAQDKEKDYVFSEKNFLPEGTRPGIVGGTPAGKRAMVVNVDQTPGLELLSTGDQFDLLATLPGNGATGSNVDYAALLGGIKAPDLRVGQRATSGGVRVLIQGGTLISLSKTTPPVNNRSNRTTTSTLATIALAPEEVALLTEALGNSTQMFCVARSGQPEDAEEAARSIAGKIAIPALARSIAAFSRITQDDLADPATGKLNVYYFAEENVNEEWLVEPESLIGRVVNRDIPRGHLFTSDDLMPAGTRAGIAAGAPPGMRIFIAPLSRIQGLAGLEIGDTVTIYGTLGKAVDAPPPRLDWASLKGGTADSDSERLSREVRAGIRTVVKKARIIRLGQGGGQVTFAVDPEEVTSLSQAINSDIEIFAVAASSQGEAQSPPAQPLSAEAGSDRYQAFKMLIADTTQSNANLFDDNPFKDDAARSTDITPRQLPPTRLGGAANTRNNNAQIQPLARDNADVPNNWVSFPVTARPVRAFERLTIEDFVDPSTGRLRLFSFPPDKVAEGWMGDLESLIDRVVATDIDSGRVIRGSDLLPEGTRPGPAAGIPPGWRSMVVTHLDIEGLESTREGDHLDLVESQVFAMDEVSQIVPEIQTARRSTTDFPKPEDIFPQSEVSIIARDVRVITRAEEVREVVVTTEVESAMREVVTDGGVQREGVKRTQEPRVVEQKVVVCTLAVRPEEVPRLAKTLATKAKVYAAMVSSNANAPANNRPVLDASGLEPIRKTWDATGGRIHKVEHIRGTSRNSEQWLQGRRFGDTPLGAIRNSQP
jgi:hypothetical protein